MPFSHLWRLWRLVTPELLLLQHIFIWKYVNTNIMFIVYFIFRRNQRFMSSIASLHESIVKKMQTIQQNNLHLLDASQKCNFKKMVRKLFR